MTVQAVTECQAKGISFEETFRYQYVISKTASSLPGFKSRVVDGFLIQSGKDLKVCDLIDGSGAVIGCFLGVAAGHDGALIDGQPIAKLDAGDPAFWKRFAEWIRHVAGRYAVVVTARGETRYYCDAVGMIGACYSSETGRIASSTFLCTDQELRFNPVFNRDEIEAGKAIDGLLMTEDETVKRLNPSFFIRLSDLSQERFWPLTELFEANEEQYLDIYSEIIAAEQNIITAITSAHPTSLAMSGGNDSRVLLALAGPARENFAIIHTNINNYAGRRDAVCAQMTCQALGLRHATFNRSKSIMPTDLDKVIAQYQIAAGTVGPAPAEVRNGLVKRLPDNLVIMRGHQTNHLRGQYLPSAAKGRWMRVPWQVKRMDLLPRPVADMEAAKRFYPIIEGVVASQSKNANIRRAEITFIETLISTALGKLFNGMTHGFYLSPYNSRRLIELSLSFDTAYRFANLTTQDLLHLAEPSITSVPFIWEMPANLDDPPDHEKLAQKRLDIEARIERLRQLADVKPETEQAVEQGPDKP